MKLSRPERLRRAFRKFSGRILTRRQVIDAAMGRETLENWWHSDRQRFSMALSAMKNKGEVRIFKLKGQEGYCLLDDYNPEVSHA